MNYQITSFRHAEVILNEPAFVDQYIELLEIIQNISDEALIIQHESYGVESLEFLPKSLSVTINHLLKQSFEEKSWTPESYIFQDSEYQGNRWRLDFAKKDISVEVAFNHSGSVAWNLIKPVLASELNHVQKSIQTKVGVLITATKAMQEAGGFDGAVGTYEQYIAYLPPLQNLLTVPLLIIGLTPPETFKMEHIQFAPRKKIGKIKMY